MVIYRMPEFVGPVQHLFCLVCACPVPFCGIDAHLFCKPPVAVLDDGDVRRDMRKLHQQVSLVQGKKKIAEIHRGVTSTTMPPSG